MATKTKTDEVVETMQDEKTLKDALDARAAELAQAKKEATTLKEKISALEAELNDVNAQKSNTESIYLSQINALQNDLQASRNENAEANAKIANLEAEKNSIIQQFEEQRNLLQKVSDNLYTYRSALITIIKDIN